jgi:imidazolonepropionase
MSERPVADFALTGASELVTCAGPSPAAGPQQRRVSVLEDGAVAARDGRIVWVGPERRINRDVDLLPGATVIDVRGRAVLPGFVDCHTHLVWSGNRAQEFERRLAGATYSEIAASGGGILSTVDATRDTPADELTAMARARMERLSRNGVTAVEVKSGYGLETDAEIKILEAARAAGESVPLEVVTTFLGAHTLPREARGSAAAREHYIDQVCAEMIPRVAERGLARFADVFVDDHAFSIDEARRILTTARHHGLGLKLHADQLRADGAAELAAELGAVSADHLDHVSDRGIAALAAAGTIAVLLPAAALFLKSRTAAPARKLIDAGVPVALSTDLNPGSCPCESLPLVLQLGCLLYDMTVDEAIVAGTLNAAAAAGLDDRCGSVERGKRCDLVVVDAAEHRQLIYQLGGPRLHMVIAAGRIVS